MPQKFPDWITKPMLKGARRFNLDAYLLALEGWRRGLTLRWYYHSKPYSDIEIIGYNPIGKIFSLSSNNKTHFFYRSRGDLVSTNSVRIVGNKAKTKQFLLKENVKTPYGEYFTKNHSTEDIIRFISGQKNNSFVIKPCHGSLGKGVLIKPKTINDCVDAINTIRNELNYEEIIVEEYVEGEDVRIYVIDNQVVAATKRLPANIIGDGESTINHLIEKKNTLRKKNPHLATKTIKIDEKLNETLRKQNINLDTVIDENEILYLGDKANAAAGGDTINILSEIPNYVKKTAVNAVNAIPGLIHAGVDIIFNKKERTASVLEINATADISLHIFPFSGQPINVEKRIIDYYFPETKEVFKNNKLFFNYKSIHEMLNNRAVNYLEITDTINKPLYAKRYIVKGKVQGVGFRNYIRKQALLRKLNGYVKNLKNGNVVVVVASTDEKVVNDFKSICIKGSLRSAVDEVIEYKWEKQINVGFEIRK